MTLEELSGLQRFLKSPYFNTNPTLVHLGQLLKETYPGFHSVKLTKERVFKRLYPGKAFNYSVLSNVFSDMIKLLQRYLTQLQLEQGTYLKKQLLLDAYGTRQGWQDQFQKQRIQMERGLEKEPVKNAQYYQQRFRLRQIHFDYHSTDNFKLAGAAYEETMGFLDQWYLLEKLLLSCEMKAREQPLSESHEIWMLDDLKSKVKEQEHVQPLVLVYIQMLELIAHPAESTYFKLKASFHENIQLFSFKQKQNILQSLINFAIHKGNRGLAAFVQESFEWYQVGLENSLFLEHGVLNERIYTNIAITSLKLEAYDWCKSFIEGHDKYLDERIREDAKALCTAFWLYYQGKADETIAYLNRINFITDFYKIRTKSLLLRVYFEEMGSDFNLFNFFEMQAQAFEKFLRRNKSLSKTRIRAYLNFSILVRKLARLKWDVNMKEKEVLKLKNRIINIDYVFEKSWLLRQVELL